MVTKQEIKEGLIRLGIEPGMILEVHSSLSSFGEVEGGAPTVIDALKEVVTFEGSIFMPALGFSKEMDLSEADQELGITVKIKILPRASKRTAMGIIADTFRSLPDTHTSEEVIATSGWGKYGMEAVKGGLDYPIHNGGKALLLGVDIYKLTAMHYVEDVTPQDITRRYQPTEAINAIYPPEEWVIEVGHPPVKAWYKIQEKAFDLGLIKETYIGACRAWFMDIKAILDLYKMELINNPYEFWEMEEANEGEKE